MNPATAITKDVILDLYPLYATNECSADTRQLVEAYLQQNPREAAALQRIMNTPAPGKAPAPARLDEMEALQRARCQLRRRAWWLGLAIFFSLCPFSVYNIDGHTHWMLLDSPLSALAYATVAGFFWIAYFRCRNRSQTL